MDGRKHLLEPFKSLQNFRSIVALTTTQNFISNLYAEANANLESLPTIVDIMMISGECSDREAVFACENVVKTILEDTTALGDEGFLLLAACNYTLAKLAVDRRKLESANQILATVTACLHKYDATQAPYRAPWHEPYFEYLQYCTHRLQGEIYLLNEEYRKSAQHFRLAQGYCVPPHITSGAAILQSYLGMIHVTLGDVDAGFSMLAQAERMFDPAVRVISLDWMRHRCNLGSAFQAAQVYEKALVEFEAVLAMQNHLFDPDSDYVCLEIESTQWLSDTHTAIANIATSLGNHEKAALHLAKADALINEYNNPNEDADDENFTDAVEMDWSPLPRRYVVIPNPAFGLDIDFADNPANENTPPENNSAHYRGPRS